MVPRQLQQRRRSRQVLLPVPPLCLRDPVSFHPVPLPHRVVGILQLQLRQRIGLALPESPVQSVELIQENAQRPFIGNDVVHGDQKNVLILVHLQQLSTNQCPARQIEGTPNFFFDPPRQLLARLTSLPQIFFSQLETRLLDLLNPLYRLSLHHRKRRPQHFMPHHDPIQRPPQCSRS